MLCRLHHVHRADDIRHRIADRLLDALRDAHLCRLMQDIADTLARTIARCGVADIPLDKFKLRVAAESCDVLLVSRQQVIQYAHSVSHREQSLGQIRSDEARTACDEE